MTEFSMHFDSNGHVLSATVPRYAFKYAAINENTLASLSESYLWFSRSNEFNDIFELPTRVPTSFTKDEIRAYLRANMSYHFAKFGLKCATEDELDATIDGLLSSSPDLLPKLFHLTQEVRRDLVRIHCLSMRYDDPLMWGHYAAAYAGVCLVYDFPGLLQAGPWFAVQVMYVDEPPTFDPIEQSLRQLAASSPYEDFVAHFEYDQLQFGTKLSAWSHEQEIRLCTLKPEAKHSFPRSALVGVILGPKVSLEAKALVHTAAAEGRERITIETLELDSQRGILLVPGLRNYNVKLHVAGLRNLSRESGRGKRSDGDA